MNHEITATYAAILGILVAVLAFATVIARAKSGVSWGHGDKPVLQRAIRAHGNLIEYAPVFLIILLILENTAADPFWLHVLGASFVVGRIISAAYFWLLQAFALRVVALWGAVLPLVAGSIMLLVQA